MNRSIVCFVSLFGLTTIFTSSVVHAANIYAVVSSNSSGQFCHFQLSDLPADIGCYGTGLHSDTPGISPSNKWRHITMTVGSGEQIIYVDGVATQTDAVSINNITTSSAVTIGRGFRDGRYFLGFIDEVAIYDSALSGDRVLRHYNAALSGGFGNYETEVFADDPFVYWRLDEVSGSIAIDSSGNGRHGLYNGGVTLGAPSAFSGGNVASAFFDGTSSYVSLPGTWGDVPEITIEAWVNTVVPVPAAVWFLISGIIGLVTFVRRTH